MIRVCYLVKLFFLTIKLEVDLETVPDYAVSFVAFFAFQIIVVNHVNHVLSYGIGCTYSITFEAFRQGFGPVAILHGVSYESTNALVIVFAPNAPRTNLFSFSAFVIQANYIAFSIYIFIGRYDICFIEVRIQISSAQSNILVECIFCRYIPNVVIFAFFYVGVIASCNIITIIIESILRSLNAS